MFLGNENVTLVPLNSYSPVKKQEKVRAMHSGFVVSLKCF